MRTLLFSGCVLVLSGCSGSMDQTLDTLSTGFAERFGVREIGVEDLNSFSADLIVDVRTAEEQSISMIPGAVAVRPDTDLSGLSEFANARRIVVYCAAGYRSARAIAALPSDRRGVREIYSLRGGIISYANAPAGRHFRAESARLQCRVGRFCARAGAGRT